MNEAGFRQAQIRIEREAEFRQLRAALERVLAHDVVKDFLKQLRRKGLRVRQLEMILAGGLVEQLDPELARSATTARALYEALTLSDQAQMREFYLTRVEQVDVALRARFHAQFETY